MGIMKGSSAKEGANPTSQYLLKSAGRSGRSSVVRGGGMKGIGGGPQDQYRETVGGKPYKLTNRSINRSR